MATCKLSKFIATMKTRVQKLYYGFLSRCSVRTKTVYASKDHINGVYDSFLIYYLTKIA